MKALARLPAVQGIAAMNSINVMAVMLAYHLPSNNALAAVEPTNHDAEAHWRRYVADWTRGNHVRVAAGHAAAVALTGALHVGEPATATHPESQVAARSGGAASGLVLGATALTTGLLAGIIYAWSVQVMPGLGQADDRTLVDAMQQINEASENPVFLLSFMAAPLLIVAALVLDYRSGSRQVVGWLVAALVLCAVAVIVVTGAVHIPLKRRPEAGRRSGPDREHRPGARRLLRPLGRLEHRPDCGPDRRPRLPHLRPDAPRTEDIGSLGR